jgi:hypothetical protein
MRSHIPRFGSLLCCAAVAAACAKSNDQRAAESAAAAPPPAAAPAATPAAPSPISFADVAGKWNMRSVPESGDTTPTTYVMTAGSDSTGWKLAFPGGPTVATRVVASGDSIVADAGPYASVRRKGVQVTTHSVFRREGDRLVGTTVAHYKTTKPDSVLRLRSEGTRAP